MWPLPLLLPNSTWPCESQSPLRSQLKCLFFRGPLPDSLRLPEVPIHGLPSPCNMEIKYCAIWCLMKSGTMCTSFTTTYYAARRLHTEMRPWRMEDFLLGFFQDLVWFSDPGFAIYYLVCFWLSFLIYKVGIIMELWVRVWE